MLKLLRGLTPAQTLVVVVAGLLPLVHSMLLTRYFRTPQLALLIVAIGGMTAASVNGSPAWLRREPRTVKLSVALFAAAVAWMTIAALVGVDPVRSLMGHSSQSTGLLMWFAAFGLYVLALRHRFAVADRVESATLFAWTVLLVFLLMWVSARDLVQEFLVPVSAEGVPLPGIGQSAFLGSFASVGLLLAAGRWILAPRKIGWLAMAATLTGFVAVTQARVPIVVTATLLVAGALIVLSRGESARVVASVVLVVTAAGVVSHLVLVPRLVPPGPPPVGSIGERTLGDRDQRGRFAPGQLTSGARFRTTAWGVAGRAIQREPLFGNGPANFTYSYRKLSSLTNLKRIGEAPDTEIQDVHNIFLEVAATSGLPAAMFLLAGMFSLGWSVLDKPRRFGLTWLRLAPLALLGVLLVEPLSLVVLPLMAIFGGIAAGGEESAHLLSRPWSAVRRVPALAVLFVATVAAASLIWSDRLLARGSVAWDRHALALAIKFDPTCQTCLYELGKVRSWDFKKKGEGSEAWALAPFETAVERRPMDSESHLRLGRGLIFLNRHPLAIPPLLRAKRLDPHSPAVSVALAAAYLHTGRPSEAMSSAKDAVRVQPSAVAFEIIAEAAGRLGFTAVRDMALTEARRLELVGR